MGKDNNLPRLANEVEGGVNTTTDSLKASQSIEPTKVTSDGDLLHILKLVLKKVDVLEIHIIKLDVKIDHLRRNTPPKTDKVPQLGVIDIDKL